MHLLVVRLNDSAIDLYCMRNLLHAFIGGSVDDSAIDLCCMRNLLHAFIGGSVELFSNAKLVVRSTEL